MARPRVFISSTFYDLKYVRSSLEIFVSSLGFEAILFEKGSIAFHPDAALDESCYREAQNADIFVLIIGGRYGSATSTAVAKSNRKPHETYESITRKEFETAQAADVPTFILIDSTVNSEFQTYSRNKNNKNVSYAHVDSVNIFSLIESIYEKRRNNPVFSFGKPEEIESWLREQWAGLFRELLRQRSQQKQLATLNAQVGELQSINTTLKNYLEEVLNKVSPDASTNIIKNEETKLKLERQVRRLEEAKFYRYMRHRIINEDFAKRLISEPNSKNELIALIDELIERPDLAEDLKSLLTDVDLAQDHFNEAREAIGLKPLAFSVENPSKNKKKAPDRPKKNKQV